MTRECCVHNPCLNTHIEDVPHFSFRLAEVVILTRVNVSGGVCGGARRLKGGRHKTAMVVEEEKSHKEKWDQSEGVGTAGTNLSAEILSSLKKGVLLANA